MTITITGRQVKTACLIAAAGGAFIGDKHPVEGVIIGIVAVAICMFVWWVE